MINDGEVCWTDALLKRMIPVPHPEIHPYKRKPLSKLWAQGRKDMQKLMPLLDMSPSPGPQAPSAGSVCHEEMKLCEEAFHDAEVPTSLDVQSQAIAAVLLGHFHGEFYRPLRKNALRNLLDLWRDVEGVEFVIPVMLETLNWQRQTSRNSSDRYVLWRAAHLVDGGWQHRENRTGTLDGWLDLRWWLGTLTPEEFERVKAAAVEARRNVSLFARCALTSAFGEPEWARQDLTEVKSQQDSLGYDVGRYTRMLLYAIDEACLDDYLDLPQSDTPDHDVVYALALGPQAPRLIEHMHIRIPRKNQDTRGTRKKMRECVTTHISAVHSVWAAKWFLEHYSIYPWKGEAHDAFFAYASEQIHWVALAILEDASPERASTIVEQLRAHQSSILDELDETLRQRLISHCGGDALDTRTSESEDASAPQGALGALQDILSRYRPVGAVDHAELRSIRADAVQFILAIEDSSSQEQAIELVLRWMDTFGEHAYSWFEGWPGWFALDHPVLELITKASDHFHLKHLNNLKYISFYKGKNEVMLACATAPQLTRMHTLNLGSNRLRRKLCEAFAVSAVSRSAQVLNLTYAKFDKNALDALLGQPNSWARLNTLMLDRVELKAGEDELVILGKRTDLALEHLSITPRDAQSLKEFLVSPACKTVKSMSLTLNQEDLIEVVALSDKLDELEHLGLTLGFSKDEEASHTLDKFFSSKGFSNLKSLSLHQVTSASCLEMLQHVQFAQLESLKISFSNGVITSESYASGRQRALDRVLQSSWPSLKNLSVSCALRISQSLSISAILASSMTRRSNMCSHIAHAVSSRRCALSMLKIIAISICSHRSLMSPLCERVSPTQMVRELYIRTPHAWSWLARTRRGELGQHRGISPRYVRVKMNTIQGVYLCRIHSSS
jgi:uncharacterized protein YbdZ (MbtH family)